MKKTIIGTLVGALILFIWQFLSWTILNLHVGNQTYTPKQDEVLKYLGDNLEEGAYYLPTLPEGSSQEENQKFMEEQIGKPWAQVFYHKSMKMNMTTNMMRGLLVDFVAMFLLIWVIMKMGNASFNTIFLTSVIMGFVGYLSTTYTYSIWFETKTLPDLIDALVSFGLVGLWLGWWLRRN